MHMCIVFHSPVYVYALRVFVKCLFTPKMLWPPQEKFRKKTHFTQRKRAPPAIVILLLSFGTFLCDTHTRARVFVSLFDINERAIAFIHSSLARSARARSRFHRSERVAKIILFTPGSAHKRARAPKKKSKTARESDPSFFITTRFQKSGSLFGSMRERRGERLSSSFVVEEVRSIDRSFASRVFLFCSQTLSLYINNFEKQAPFERSITLPWTTRASFYSKKEFLNKKSLKKEQNII